MLRRTNFDINLTKKAGNLPPSFATAAQFVRLRENLEQALQVGLFGGIALQGRDAEDLLQGSQCRSMRIVGAVGIAAAFGEWGKNDHGMGPSPLAASSKTMKIAPPLR